jgi:predicted nucleotidyltransferase
MSRTIDVSPTELSMITDILRAHLPAGIRAWALGSRATGAARRYSDFDLALEGPAALDLTILGEVAEALSESDLPFKVDILDLKATDPAFRAAIEPDLIALPL